MTNDEMILLTITDLKQYVFCPRVVFYESCLSAVRPRTYKMDAGAEAHETEQARAGRRTLDAYHLPEGERLLDVRVQSARLGLTGILDEIILTPDEAIVVDYKLANFAGANHLLQLTAYAMLTEERFNRPVARGYIYLLGRRRFEEMAIGKEFRNSVLTALDEIRQIIVHERMPPPSRQRNKCISCEFRRFCNDV